MRQIDTKFSQNWKFDFKKSFVFYHQYLLKVWRKIEYFFSILNEQIHLCSKTPFYTNLDIFNDIPALSQI